MRAGVIDGFELRVVGDPPLAQASDAGIARAGFAARWSTTSIAIAALYRSLARRLMRQSAAQLGHRPRSTRAIVVENKWRAQRYGIHGTFVDADGNGAVSVAECSSGRSRTSMPHAEALGCHGELLRCRAIVGAGTSADAQLAVFEAQRRQREPRAAHCAPSPTGSRPRRCSKAQRRVVVSGSATCTTRPRARASTTPSAAQRKQGERLHRVARLAGSSPRPARAARSALPATRRAARGGERAHPAPADWPPAMAADSRCSNSATSALR